MSKLYRSLLWSGLVVAGVAACGDDVTVAPPPPPPPATVHSINVAPTGITVAPGSSTQMVATVQADAGVVTTVTWTLPGVPASTATISTAGVLTIAAAAPAGSIAPTACSTAVPTICNSATVTISNTASTVTGIQVTPSSAALQTSGASHTVQATASVTGTNNPPQTVTWTSLTPGVASVSATGLITGLANGSAVITACSTLAGFTNVCGSAAITVGTITPASVQILSVTWVQPSPLTSCTQGGGNSVPVVLNNVRCQIEVTVQVNSGDQQLKRVDVLMGPHNGTKKVMASQTLTVAGPGGPSLAPTSSQITLSFDTRQLRLASPGGALVPVVFNGNNEISSELFVDGGQTPGQNVIPVTMNNADQLVVLDHFTPGLSATFTPNNSTATFGSFFNATSVTFTGAQYISFSTVVPVAIPFTDALCTEDAPNSSVNGTAQTGITVSTAFDCSGQEGQMGITGFGTIVLPAGAVGPDGTTITVPDEDLSNITSGFRVPIEHDATFNPNGPPDAELRWNLITPASPAQALLGAFIDNKGPSVTVNTVAFNTLFDQPWINGAHNFVASGDVSAVDAGSGLAGPVTANLFNSTGCTTTVVVNGADPALTGPTLVSSAAGGRQICGVATDNVGNTTFSGPSNFFGIDFLPPVVRMAGTTAATPTIAPFLPTSVSTTPNTTIFQTAAGFANQIWGMEANDDRAGFDQALLVPQYPSLETLVRSLASGTTNCGLFTNALGVLLSDLFVRNNVLVPLDCNMGVGYYTWTGVVTDRAGNQASPVPATRNFAYDPGTPNITGLGYSSSLYVGGQPATFSISANDDLEIVSAALGINYSGMPNVGCPVGGCQGILYPEGTLTILDQFGNPLQPWTSGPGALPITAVINGAPITLPYFIARIDESCIFNANPYPSCDTGTNGTGSRPTIPAEYNTNLNGGGTLTDVTKGPNAVLANVADITGRESLTGISAPFLATQFTAVSQPWSAPANPFTWTGAVIGGTTIQAINTVNTSIILPFFNNGIDLTTGANAVNLFRMNTVTGSWTFCATFPAPTPQDNGINRTYTYTLPVPVSPNACATLTGPWKAMGLKSGAGLFTGAF